MLLEDKIQVFLNTAQSKICSLTLEVGAGLNDAYFGAEDISMSIELLDVCTTLQDETLDWTDKEIESVIDYYTWRAHLNDVAILNFENKESTIIIVDSSTTDNDWVPAYDALNTREAANHQYTLDEVDRLDERIDNLDFSNLVPQELIDDVDANTAARHTHDNKVVLDGITQGKIDEIGLNTTHRGTANIHTNTTERNYWNAKVDVATLNSGLATKAATSHLHEIQDVNGLEQALIDRNPVPGPAGQDGLQPVLIAGTITDGTYNITVDSTNPAFPVLNLVVPKGEDGTDFHIDEYKISSERLSNAYDNSPGGYSILGTDNGVMYYRKPFDDLGNPIPATTSTGWYAVQYAGANGWSPIFAIEVVNDATAVYKLIGWTGGTGTPPPFVNVYITATGYSPNQYEAINIRGPQGISGPAGKVMFPDQSGDTATKATYDAELKDFVYLDTTLGLIYIKRSDASGDWSDGYQWKGDTGNQGPAGDIGPTGADSTVPGPQGPTGETGQGYTDKGQWVNNVPYIPYDVVFDLGSSYNCITPVTGGNNPATNSSFALFAAKGEDGVAVGGGHTIKDSTTTLTQREGLKFIGNVEVTDDNAGNNTVVNVKSTIATSALSVDTGNVNIDFQNLQEFYATNKVLISGNASIAFLNVTNALSATFKCTISNLATLTFPVGTVVNDVRFVGRVFTPTANGDYLIEITLTNGDYYVVVSDEVGGGGTAFVDTENIFFDDITVKAKVSRPYAFAVSAKTESGGTGTITTSTNAAYTIGATVTANGYVQIEASAINTRVYLTIIAI